MPSDPNPKREAAALRNSLERNIGDRADCWLWIGRIDRHGYGRSGEARLAHRVIYEELVGPIPEGLQLDHLCRVRNCVNPDHLEPVTNAENQRRGYWATKTHCKQGHPYDEENTYLRPATSAGVRSCRKCGRAAARAYRSRAA